MKKPRFLRGIRLWGGWGEAPTTPDTVLFSGQGAFSTPCYGVVVPGVKVGSGSRNGLSFGTSMTWIPGASLWMYW